MLQIILVQEIHVTNHFGTGNSCYKSVWYRKFMLQISLVQEIKRGADGPNASLQTQCSFVNLMSGGANSPKASLQTQGACEKPQAYP